MAFERKLYVIRRMAKKSILRSNIPGRREFYVASLSCRTIVYKGMLNAGQLREFYPDLSDPEMASAIAMVHSRFSTNTFPSWSRAHPYRFISHNGEINTLRGNINWMHARQSQMASKLFGEDLKKVLTVVDTDGSDSAMFDNVLELLHLSGRSLPHAMMMMVPEPWAKHESMSPEKKAFYEFHSCLMEPWDGPASIAFTDGELVGATLDRNGLRPARYYVTHDGLVVMASEVGVLDIPVENVKQKGRLQPGRMFLVDTREKRIVPDDELKQRVASAEPYAEWLKEYLVKLEDLPAAPSVHEPDHETVLRRQETFGYTAEDLKIVINPMATTGGEPLGSMGTDTPLAVLSEKPQLLYGYFKQLFAQVTNPPVDAIREEIIMGIETAVGPEGNMLEPTPEACRQLEVPTPVLTNEDLERLRALDGGPRSRGFRSITLPALFPVADGGAGLRRAIEDMQVQASEAIAEGHNLLIISDRGHDEWDAPIPALLAVSAVHHHLLREGTRTKVGIVVESGEPREVHHFALLIGYGASAVNPYLAFETIDDQVRQGLIPGPAAKAEKKYIKAVNKGISKVISKMGISTIQSYHGAQVFEAVGLNQDFIDEYFTWTSSRIGGVGIDVVAREVKERHYRAYPPRAIRHTTLGTGGQYQYRADGEYHLFNPETVHRLQHACRTGSYAAYKEYAALVNNQSKTLCTLRGLMDFRPGARPVPLAEVESVEAILRRFKTGAMSYGSISQEAHEALAVAMNRIGGKSNTGEGGEDPARFTPMPNGDSKNSAIKQVASARFGVTSDYLVHAKELQIKVAQGAKPGEGGQLPGHKVYPWIAKVRHSTPGVGLISPPPHHDIYSIEDLAQLIHDLKNANRGARISVKLVAEVGVGTIAAGVAKAHADVILISGYDGGTGASPLTSIKHAGIPWELGPRRGPSGAAPQQPALPGHRGGRRPAQDRPRRGRGRAARRRGVRLRHRAAGRPGLHHDAGLPPEHLPGRRGHPGPGAAQALHRRPGPRGELHALRGHRAARVHGRAGLPHHRRDGGPPGAAGDAPRRRPLEGPEPRLLPHPLPAPGARRSGRAPARSSQDHGIEQSLDVTTLLELCRPAIEQGKKVEAVVPIRNVNRVVGTITGSEVTRRWGPDGLPDDTIRLTFQGSAGQSFGAFIPPGMTLRARGRRQRLHRQGALGRAHRRLPAQGSHLRRRGERHHRQRGLLRGHRRRGLHPRRGRRALLRAQLGRHRGGRGGGRPRLRVHDRRHGGGARQDRAQLRGRHVGRHGLRARRGRRVREGAQPGDGRLRAAHRPGRGRPGARARRAPRRAHRLARWAGASSTPGRRRAARFVRVVPNDYRRVLEAQARMRAKGLSPDEAEMAAFEENARDEARVGGN